MSLKPFQVPSDHPDLKFLKQYEIPIQGILKKNPSRNGVIGKRKVRLDPIEINDLKSSVNLKNNYQDLLTFATKYKESQSLSPRGPNGKLGGILKTKLVQSEKEPIMKPDRVLHLAFTKQAAKKPNLFNGEHIEIPGFPNDKFKDLDIDNIMKFSEKYSLMFTEGINENLLQKCVEITNTETDPSALESNFPGLYTDYLPEKKKLNSHSQALLSLNTSTSSLVPRGSNIKSLSRDGQSNTSKSIDQSELNFGRGPLSAQDRTSTSYYSNFSLGGLGIALPKIDLDTFRDQLGFFKEFTKSAKFYFIKSAFKKSTLEIGYAEIIFDDRKKGGKLSKYFIPRVYRKMKMTIPITIFFLHHLFSIEKLDKVNIDLSAQYESMQRDLTALGFKLDKIYLVSEKKIKSYIIKKKEFYDFIEEAIPGFLKNN